MSFHCFHCSSSFSSKAKVKQHISKDVCLRKIHQCWCGKGCTSKSALLLHTRRYHPDFRQKSETTPLNFNNLTEFEKWKTAIEEKTVTKFVKPWASYVKKNGSKMTRFACHRSGNARIITEGRKRKRSLSCKINNYCPAYISVEELPDFSIRGEYYGKHCNHENDVKYITLSRKEKSQIADDLNKGATFEEILDKNRSKMTNGSCSDTKRIRELTRKDLHNVMLEYKISFKKEPAKNIKSIHTFMQECSEQFGENNPIKFFKPQNDESKNNIDAEDLIMVLMTSAQKQLLSEFQNRQICLDSTHGLQGYEIHLTSIYTINDAGISLPVAFCISSTVNENVMSVFFSTVLKECDHLSTSVFISEDIPAYINAWCKVVNVPSKWQVDKFLRKSLRKLNGPVDLNTQADKYLRSFLKEMNDQVFTILLKNFVTKLLENDSTHVFGRYFERDFTPWPSECLYDYRSHMMIHANFRIEAMYRVLRDFYFKGLKVRRLDFSIFRLLKTCWDDSFHRLWHFTKEVDVYTLKIFRNRHNAALLIQPACIVRKEQFYEIKSCKDSRKTYSVERKNETCSCRLKCNECDLCFHTYSCTCIDYYIMRNVCKHIHAVCIRKNKADIEEIGVCYNQKNQLAVETVYSSKDALGLGDKINPSHNLHQNQELIDSLLYMIHSLQTLNYDGEDYAVGADHIKKACDILCKTGLEKFGDESGKCDQQPRRFYPYKKKNYACSDGDEKESIAEQVQIESVDNESLVHEIEEIVYIDNVDVDYYDHCY